MNQPLNAPNRPATPTETMKARAFPISGCERAERTEEDDRRERARNRHQRADREVDAAGRDDQRHADRDDDDGRDLGEVDVQRLQTGEMRRRDEIEREQHDERRQRGVAPEERRPRRAKRPCGRSSARQPSAGFRVGRRVAVRHRRHDRGGARFRVGQVGDRAPVAQHEYAVSAFDDLLELGGDHQHAQALIGELADERLNLGLGADVDAARRLVEDQQLRIGAEPSREQDLLLIAAGKLANLLFGARSLDGETLHEAIDDFALARFVDDRPFSSGEAGCRA